MNSSSKFFLLNAGMMDTLNCLPVLETKILRKFIFSQITGDLLLLYLEASCLDLFVDYLVRRTAIRNHYTYKLKFKN